MRNLKKDRYIYYHCTFDKGSCGGAYVREEELERQFEEIFAGFEFPEAIVEWIKEALRQNERERAVFHDTAIQKLRAQYDKLQNRISHIYLDKLDGEIEETFYRRCVKAWSEEQTKIENRIRRHREANLNYIEQGIRLLDLAQNTGDIFRHKGQAERTELIRFVMPDSLLERDTVIPTFKPPFDIIHKLAVEAREVAQRYVLEGENERRAAPIPETARLVLLPGVDSNFSF